MNCQQFTSLIVEVARGQMLDAAARDGATRHAETCQPCAARLAQEQSLTVALRTVALSMKEQSAPASVEAKLLAAFRENSSIAQAASNSPTPLSFRARSERHAQVEDRPSRRIAAIVATAIAASLVLVALAMLSSQLMQTATPPALVMDNKPPRIAETPGSDKPTNPMPTVLTPPAISDGATRQAKGGKPLEVKRGGEPQRAAIKLAGITTPKMITSQQVIDGGNAIIEVSEGQTTFNNAGGAAKPEEAESVTEFISLVAGTPDAPPLESGQLVRVQLPRAALASLGLPSNIERQNEPVKADVLLGYDGLARAIRFVR
jgi:hypothetical protein